MSKITFFDNPIYEKSPMELLFEENRKFRRLLFIELRQRRGYSDDGEMQDATAMPMIDFVRDSANDIENKMIQRGLGKLTSAMGLLSL